MSSSAPVLIVCENSRKAETYALALTALGFDPERIRVLTPDTVNGDVPELAARAVGVVLCGGPDVEPWRFGEEPLQEADLSLMPELDELEWSVLEVARSARLPVWAICRGLQVLNVFLSGTLWQDLALQLPGSLNHDVPHPNDALAHEIRPTGCRHPFAERLFGENPRVNTRHHQAVKEVSPALTALATSPDGVVEAVGGATEHETDGWWVRGVQWHPENLTALVLQRQLFADFLAAVARRTGLSGNGNDRGR
jgi:putative glutamine amidotransferase